jgi:FkbM family methyltransferase
MIIFDIGTGLESNYISNKIFEENDRIYFFEPVEQLIETLNERIKNNQLKNCYTIQKAVSNYEAISKFNIAGTNNHNLSSLLNFSDNCMNVWPGRNDFIVTQHTKVSVTRLDIFIDSLEEKINCIDYLNIDANGSDLDILHGLGKYISLVHEGSLIASIIPEAIYLNQNSLSETTDFLKLNQFAITNVYPIDQYGNQAKIYFTKII